MRRDEVSALTLPDGKSDHLIPDGTVPGLALRLRATGGRSWIFSYRIGNKQRRMTLGPATMLSVQEARRFAGRRNRQSQAAAFPHSTAGAGA